MTGGVNAGEKMKGPVTDCSARMNACLYFESVRNQNDGFVCHMKDATRNNDWY